MRGMKLPTIGLVVLLAVATTVASAIPTPTFASAPPSSNADAIVAALATRLAAISTYKADIIIRVKMKSFPFFGASFYGTTTYKRPGEFTANFKQSSLAHGYATALADMGDPAVWKQSYNVAIDGGRSSDAGTLALRLVPKTPRDVDHTVAVVDVPTMTVRRITWYYTNGGTIDMHENYAPVAGILMPAHQDIDISLPTERVRAKADLSHYALNADLSSADLSSAK